MLARGTNTDPHLMSFGGDNLPGANNFENIKRDILLTSSGAGIIL